MFDFLKNTDGEDRDAYKSIAKNAKEYGELHLQLLKLNAVGSLSQIISYLIIIIVGALLLMGAFLYFSMILVIWLYEGRSLLEFTLTFSGMSDTASSSRPAFFIASLSRYTRATSLLFLSTTMDSAT